MLDVKGLVKEAKAKVVDFDIILDPYDLTIVWVDPINVKEYGYKPVDLIGEQVFKFTTLPHNKVMEIAVRLLHFSFWGAVGVKKKDGSVVKRKIKTTKIIFDKQPYLIKKFVRV